MDSQGTTTTSFLTSVPLSFYSAGVVNTVINVITKIGVRIQGTSSTCHSVKVDLDNCSASLDGAYVNKSSTALVDGVRLSARWSHIRVSVPNCEVSRSITLWVTCITRHSESLLEVVVSRGDGLEPTARGVIGVFIWSQMYCSLYISCEILQGGLSVIRPCSIFV